MGLVATRRLVRQPIWSGYLSSTQRKSAAVGWHASCFFGTQSGPRFQSTCPPLTKVFLALHLTSVPLSAYALPAIQDDLLGRASSCICLLRETRKETCIPVVLQIPPIPLGYRERGVQVAHRQPINSVHTVGLATKNECGRILVEH